MMCAEEVFAEVKKQQPYIRGITVSGGECTLYPDFLEKLFVLARGAGLGTLIDSNGTLDFEVSAASCRDGRRYAGYQELGSGGSSARHGGSQ